MNYLTGCGRPSGYRRLLVAPATLRARLLELRLAVRDRDLGLGVFRRIMTDRRFARIPKVIETPKGEGRANDIRMLRRLRA